MEVLGDVVLPDDPPFLWLLLRCSGAGLVSLLPGLEDSELGLRPPCRPADSRLELCCSDTGSWYGLKRSRGRDEVRKGFLESGLEVLVAGSAEAEAAAAAAAM